ncbi:MAG: uL22 family ribosomal protein [bacterium]
MEAISRARYQRYGRRKVGQVLNELRGKDLLKAGALMDLIPRVAAAAVKKTVDSAAANLSVKLGRKLDPSQVWIKTVFADNGPMKQLRRMQPGPQGRAMPFKRKMCHITVVVSDTKQEGK